MTKSSTSEPGTNARSSEFLAGKGLHSQDVPMIVSVEDDGTFVRDRHVLDMSIDKLITGTLSAEMLLSDYIRTASTGARVELDGTSASKGLKVFDSGGIQRGYISTDGSGWWGDQTKFSWTASGVLSVNGVIINDATISNTQIISLAVDKLTAGTLSADMTLSALIKTASAGARIVIDGSSTTKGLKLYNASDVQTVLLNTDGSGWLGALADFSWDTAGVVSINGAKIQTLTVGTLQIANLGVTTGKIANEAVTKGKADLYYYYETETTPSIGAGAYVDITYAPAQDTLDLEGSPEILVLIL